MEWNLHKKETNLVIEDNYLKTNVSEVSEDKKRHFAN